MREEALAVVKRSDRMVEEVLASKDAAIELAAKYHERLLEHMCCKRCPGCSQVFAGFDGCAEITCQYCGQPFCGLCLHATPGDTQHAHVSSLCEVRRFIVIGEGDTFPDMRSLENYWEIKQKGLIAKYVSNLPEAVRRQLPKHYRDAEGGRKRSLPQAPPAKRAATSAA